MFFEVTTATGIPLNDEKFGMLYGNHIRRLIRRRTGLSRFQGITYGLWAKECYTEARRGYEFMEATFFVATAIGIIRDVCGSLVFYEGFQASGQTHN